MANQSRILQFVVLMVSLGACYCTLQEDPHRVYLDDSPTTTDDGGTFKKSPDDLRLKRLGKLAGPSPSRNTINVNDHGAKGDGITDDTQAFKKAWQVACSSFGEEAVSLVVPQQNYLLKPITFSGPCKSDITVQISGVLEASDNPSDYIHDPTHWLEFKSVQSLSVEGGGTINGNGNIWWQNSCNRNETLVSHRNKARSIYISFFHI